MARLPLAASAALEWSTHGPPRAPYPRGSRATTLLLNVVCLFGLVIVIQASLGFMGLLSAAPLVLLAAALLALAAVVAGHPVWLSGGSGSSWWWRARQPVVPVEPWTALDCAGAAALATALCERAWAGVHRSTFLYDVLSYHLHLPAAWRAASRIYLVPTPFGDPAAAYAPSNAELLYQMALAATGNARLAHAGQLPFAGLAALAIYTTARLLGGTRAAGFAGALAFILVPEVWQQVPTAMADLGTAAFFLAALPFLLQLRTAPAPGPALLGLGTALGLLVGTKYISVVLALPLLTWAVVVLARRRGERRARPNAMAALGVIALMVSCGGFWYLRNLLLTGNPLFPATLSVGSWTLAPGLYDGAVMRTSEYHLPRTQLQPLLEILSESGWGFLAGAALAIVATRPWHWLALATAVLGIDWLVIPYQQSRFFFSLWGVLSIIMALAPGRAPRAGRAALLVATAGSLLQFPTGGRLLLLAAAAAGALVGPWLLALAPRHANAAAKTNAPAAVRVSSTAIPPPRLDGRRALVRAWWGIVGSGALASLLVWARVHPGEVPYGVGDGHDAAWAWFRAYAGGSGKRIAYAGSNLPLPLWGARFENEVRYVGVSVATGATPCVAPVPAPSSSCAPHHFLHVPGGSAEPEPEREAPALEAWLANMKFHRIQLLFVTAMYPGVQRTIAHDGDGFPVERAWADAHPRMFPLLFAVDAVRVYAVGEVTTPAEGQNAVPPDPAIVPASPVPRVPPTPHRVRR